MDLGDATHEQFEPLLHETFLVTYEGGEPLLMELVAVEKRGFFDAAVHRRQAFSLLFRGPSDPVLSQRMYSLSGKSVGELVVFLVPVGQASGGILYEAVFT